MVCVCAALLATEITLGAAGCGRSVSVATRVCPLERKLMTMLYVTYMLPYISVEDRQCHRHVALRPVRVSMLYATITTTYLSQ